MKICTQCGIEKPLNAFNASKVSMDKHAYECKSCHLTRYTVWRTHNPILVRCIQRKRLVRVKQEVFNAYGAKCACCSEDELNFLTIDHVYNDGYLDKSGRRRKGGLVLYYELKRLNFPKDRYQLLCMNCNFGKKITNGMCPHQIKMNKNKEILSKKETI